MLLIQIPTPDVLKGVDDLIRSDLEAYRSTCFNWLLGATGVVVAGLLLELPEIWLESRNAFSEMRRSGASERHIPGWAKLVVSLGWLLIVVGVAGEYVADSFVSKADGYVQTFDETLLAEAQRRTAFASERASAAFERAAQTEKEAAEDLKATNIARQQAEEARQKAEGFNVQIAQANERAAVAERETALLKAAMADRTLTDEQVRSLTTKLKPYSGQEYEVTAYWDSKESMGIAGRVQAALQLAGWKFLPMKNFRSLFGGVVGIIVSLHPDADGSTKSAAAALVRALQQDGLQAEAQLQNAQNNPKHNTLSIRVGSKR